MVDNPTEPDVLVLDNELLLDDDEGGEEALLKEPGVLLLDEEFEPDGPMVNIAVGPETEKPKPAFRRRKGGFDLQIRGAPKEDAETPAHGSAEQEPEAGKPADQDKAATPPSKAAREKAPAAESPLARFLREARQLVEDYEAVRARTRKSLYKALGRAYDVSIAARHAPEEFDELLDAAGITVQERAPMTPIVKLVFGVDYDKTRLSEYAAVLAYARKQNVGLGELAGFIGKAEGGLKGVLQLARLGEPGTGSHEVRRTRPLPTLVHRLEELPCRHFGDLEAEGDEYTLVLARRLPDGQMGALGEVPRDIPLLEKAIRRLLAESANAPAAD